MPHPLVLHCRRDAFDVYIGRFCKGSPAAAADCTWGNPFSAKLHGGTPSERISMYERWLLSPPQRPLVAKAKLELAGKTLACWCAPKMCHGDVLARVAGESEGATERRRGELGVVEPKRPEKVLLASMVGRRRYSVVQR